MAVDLFLEVSDVQNSDWVCLRKRDSYATISKEIDTSRWKYLFENQLIDNCFQQFQKLIIEFTSRDLAY